MSNFGMARGPVDQFALQAGGMSPATPSAGPSSPLDRLDRALGELLPVVNRLENVAYRLCGPVPSRVRENPAPAGKPDGVFPSLDALAGAVLDLRARAVDALDLIEGQLP